MTIAVTLIDKSTDTFDGWVNKTNEIANLVSNSIFTANDTFSTTTGNAFGNGIFAYATVGVNTALRGGNVDTSATLPITSNVSITGDRLDIGNTTTNVYINSSSITFNYQNSTVFGGYYRTDAWWVGNSTVNASANSTSITLANSTVEYTFVKPTAAQKAANTWFLNANGSFVDLSGTVSNTSVGPGTHEIDSWLKSDFYSCEYTCVIEDNIDNNRTFTKVMVLHDETNAFYNEFGTIESNSFIGSFAATTNTTHVIFNFVNPSGTYSVFARQQFTRK